MSPTESVIRSRQTLPQTCNKPIGFVRWCIATFAALVLLAVLSPARAQEASAEASAKASPTAEAPTEADGVTPAPDDEPVLGTPRSSAKGPANASATATPTGSPTGLPEDLPTGSPTGPATLEDVLGAEADPLGRIERQIESEEFTPAIAELELRLEEIEQGSHRFDRRLVRPLTLLGDAHAGLEQYDEALGHYQRALHLSRVNLGLNTPEQVEIVYREAEALKALGDFQQANDREEYAYHVLNRTHDPMDEALLPGIYHLAEWYEHTGNVFAARALYEQAMQIIDAHEKLETPEAIPALQGIAGSYRMERFPPYYLPDDDQVGDTVVTPTTVHRPISVNNFPAGEAALQRVIRIRQEQKEEQPIPLAEAVLELADWYTLFDKPRRAEPLYAHAWELMDEVEGFDVVGYFAQPELLYFPAPGNPSPPPVESRGERGTGYVEVAFDVTEDGYVRGLNTVGSQPDGLMEFRVRKSLRLARYRPMLVEGVPVPKQAHTYRHEFPYFQQREVDPQTAATSAGG